MTPEDRLATAKAVLAELRNAEARAKEPRTGTPRLQVHMISGPEFNNPSASGCPDCARLRAELAVERERAKALARVADAAEKCLTWLGDERLSQWSYMESWKFYEDKGTYGGALECALAELRNVEARAKE